MYTYINNTMIYTKGSVQTNINGKQVEDTAWDLQAMNDEEFSGKLKLNNNTYVFRDFTEKDLGLLLNQPHSSSNIRDDLELPREVSMTLIPYPKYSYRKTPVRKLKRKKTASKKANKKKSPKRRKTKVAKKEQSRKQRKRPNANLRYRHPTPMNVNANTIY